jgi:hypothetical protein
MKTLMWMATGAVSCVLGVNAWCAESGSAKVDRAALGMSPDAVNREVDGKPLANATGSVVVVEANTLHTFRTDLIEWRIVPSAKGAGVECLVGAATGGEACLPGAATWKQEQFVNAKGGRPGHMVHTDTCMMPSGNSLFIRTVSHMYAIGDPGVPFDGRKAVP